MDSQRLWNRRFVQLFSIEAMLQFGLYLTRPLISNYAVSLGASLTLAGFLAGLLATAALVIRPVSGIVSDRLRKKTLLMISCALFSVSALGCAIFQSVILMAFFLSLQGFAFAFKSTIVVSFASLVVPKDKVGSGVGWLGLAYTVACALGPAVGSLACGTLGYAGTFAVSGALLGIGLVLAVLFKAPIETKTCETTVEKSVSSRKLGPDQHGSTYAIPNESSFAHRRVAVWARIKNCFYGPSVILSLIAGLLMIAQGVTSSFILIVGEMRGIEGASLYFLFYSFATLVARPLAGRASDKWGVVAVAPPMMIVAALGMLSVALLDSFLGILLAGICMGIGQGSAYCTIQAESVRGVPQNYLGRAANTFYLGPDLCMGLGPVVGGWILQSSGVSTMFCFNASAVGIALLIFLAYMVYRRIV